MLLHSVTHSSSNKRKLSSLQEVDEDDDPHSHSLHSPDDDHHMVVMMNQTSGFTAPPSPFHLLQIEEEEADEEELEDNALVEEEEEEEEEIHHSHIRHRHRSQGQDQKQTRELEEEDHPLFGFFGKNAKICSNSAFEEEEEMIHGHLNLFSDDLYSIRGDPGLDFSYQHSDHNLSSGSSTPSTCQGLNSIFHHAAPAKSIFIHHSDFSTQAGSSEVADRHDHDDGNLNFPCNERADNNPEIALDCRSHNLAEQGNHRSNLVNQLADHRNPDFPLDANPNFIVHDGSPNFTNEIVNSNFINEHFNENCSFTDHNESPNISLNDHHGSLVLPDILLNAHQQQQQQLLLLHHQENQQEQIIDDDRMNSFYASSAFCEVPLCEDVIVKRNDVADSADCYIGACPAGPLIATARAGRSDPSLDPQFLEFGTVHIPIRLQQEDSSLREIFKTNNMLSLELLAYHLGDGKALLQPNWVELTEDCGCPYGSYQQKTLTHNYKALIDELILNEAPGQLQVMIIPSPELEFDLEGTLDIKVFLKRQTRDDEVLLLKELLQELFPQDFELHHYLNEVEEIRNWSERTDDWTTFSGLLSDLESDGYDEAPHPVGLTVPLRSYQLQSLQFMLDAEKRKGGLLSINYHKLPPTSTSSEPLLYSASLGHLMDFREGVSCGGFLCEEMGLGKTIEILALILSNPCPVDASTSPEFSRGTLIVCPVSIVGQWANEVKSKLAANLSIYMYHGSKRIRDPKKLSKFDIIITTYATLGSDFSKATQATRHGSGFAEQFCPLLSVNWWRVVLDESHTVKDPAPLHSRACARLKAERRWCCTGTPINTSIYDLYGQFLFLKLDPLDNKDVFRRRIGRPYERNCKNEDQTVLLWTLKKMMIRHTKQQKFNGRELLKLPPKTEQDIIVTFSPEERIAYDAVYQKVVAKFEQFRSWGPTIVSKNILQIMSLLLPLRRLCSGGFISKVELHSMEYVKRENHAPVLESSIETGKAAPTDEKDGEQLEVECGICFEIMECPTRTPCKHWFCRECVMSVLGAGTLSCPTCKSSLQAEQLEITDKPSGSQLLDTDFSLSSPSSGHGCDEGVTMGVHMSSKLQTLLADLAKVREESSTAKVLIFSQFTQTIAWLKNEFKNQGITYRFISGDMPMKKRAQAIEAFQKDPPTTVFLLSIRTGAVGLTLTAASHVYMLEPCLNPALEEQAVGRCWRMGQERPVVIKRLYVADSVEANILKLLQNRRASQSKTSTTQESTESSRTKAGKNSVTDVAGCIRSDKQNLRLSEFEILFSK